jgi:hypothetical protein
VTKGRLLYDRYRVYDTDALHWNWLPQEERDFWERLAWVK